MGGGNQMARFSQILVIIAKYTMDDISHDHPILDYLYANFAGYSRDVMWCHESSPKCFSNNFAYKRATVPRMISLCSAHQDASNDIHADLEVMLRSRDLRSTFEIIICVRQSVSKRGSRQYCYFCSSSLSSKVILKKKLVFKCRYVYFCDSCDISRWGADRRPPRQYDVGLDPRLCAG